MQTFGIVDGGKVRNMTGDEIAELEARDELPEEFSSAPSENVVSA